MMMTWVEVWPPWPIIALPSGDGAKLTARGGHPLLPQRAAAEGPGPFAPLATHAEIAAIRDLNRPEAGPQPLRGPVQGLDDLAVLQPGGRLDLRAQLLAERLLEGVVGQGPRGVGIAAPVPAGDLPDDRGRVTGPGRVAGARPGLLHPRLPALGAVDLGIEGDGDRLVDGHLVRGGEQCVHHLGALMG